MIIIGIDPGPPNGKIGFVEYCLTTEFLQGETFDGAIDSLLSELHFAVGRNNRPVIVVEGIQSYGRVVGKSVIETAYLVGRVMEICRVRAVECHVVTKPTHAAATVGVANPSNKELRTSLENRFGAKKLRAAGIKNPHTRDALSCAVWLAKQKGWLTDE